MSDPNPVANAMLEVDHVGKTYTGRGEPVEAIADLQFSIGAGEFVCVVGPSGAGKTTLLRILAGLLSPTKGEVRLDGAVVSSPPEGMAVVLQEYGRSLFPWMTVAQNVEQPLKEKRVPAERRKQLVADALTAVSLGGDGDKYPWQLSGGMQQRAQLCRALIHEPALLMLDEPFGALDMFTREELWTVLQDVWLERRPTVILVTHDLREAVLLADRVLVMSARPGRVIHERVIPFERPRPLDVTFLPEFGEIVHDLRDHIATARAEAA